MSQSINKETTYRQAKPKDKPYSISDGGGLALMVKPDGTKRWTFVYRLAGRQNRLGFGLYPDTSLENARRQAAEARRQIAEGVDPAQAKAGKKAALREASANAKRQAQGLPAIGSFADIAAQWLASIAHLATAKTHAHKESRIQRLAFPSLGGRQIREIKSARVGRNRR
jgi:hypothetical protein